MEHERSLPRATAAGGGPGPDTDLEQVRAETSVMLQAADRVLDNLHPVNAEDYLQQNRQRGGE